jgi:hypothetical protein
MPLLAGTGKDGAEKEGSARRESVRREGVQRETVRRETVRRQSPSLFPVCANASCRSGWLRLWRSRQTPVIEGGWTCSPECTRAVVESCLRREMEGREEVSSLHRHRIPIGLILLEQGWISQEQLKTALEAQRQAAKAAGQEEPSVPRLGSLLLEQGLDERLLTRALGIQWSCPVLSIGNYRPEAVASLVPRVFVDAFGVLPLQVAASTVLYVAFEDRIDRCLSFGLERMTGLRVEAGVADSSEFGRAHSRMLGVRFPAARLVEAASPAVLVRALSGIIEAAKPAEARLVRVHDYFWLRMRRSPGTGRQSAVPAADEVEDVLCSLARFG